MSVDEYRADPGLDVLRLVFATSGDCVSVISPDGTVLSANPSCEAAFGDTGASPVGRRWSELWAAESRAEAGRAVLVAGRTGVAEVSCVRIGRDAALEAWRSTIVPVPHAGQGASRLLVTSRNITAEHEAARALDRSARLNKALIEATSEIVWHFDVATGITERRGWFEFTGRQDDADDADDWLGFLHADDREHAQVATDRAMIEGKSLLIEYRLQHRSGDWRWVEDHATPLLREDGTVSDWVGIVTDIHDRRMADKRVRDSEQRLRLAVEATGLATWELDMVTGRQIWSPELFAMMRIEPDASTSHEAFVERIHPDDRARIRAEFSLAVNAGRDVPPSTFRLALPSGEERWIEGRNRVFRDAAGNVVLHIGTLQDITDLKQAERRTWLAAHTDNLTQTANRTLFHIELEAAIRKAVADGSSVGVVLVDLDRFKEINDTLGLDAGDAMLRATADRLKAACPAGGTVARFGADEFGMIVPLPNGSSSLDEAVTACLPLLRHPVAHAGATFECTPSLGWAVFPEHDLDPAALLRNADLALRAAKAAGRNRSLAFDASMRVEAVRRTKVLQRTRDALDRDCVMPFYQPKVSLASGKVIGFEALLRWTDDSGLRSPGEIAEAFEDPDLAMRLGSRMLDRVVADMRDWSGSGVPFGHVALNVGPREFARDGEGRDLADRVLATLRSAALPASALEIEVTERTLLDDDASIIGPSLRRLHEAGIRLALDDFGTGYASLTHLRRFPVSYLKIDRSFVSQMLVDKGSEAIVGALIGLARNLGMGAVAEGAETAAEVAMLRKARCEIVQGFVFGKPMAASRVRHFLEAFVAEARGAAKSPARRTARRSLVAVR
ncbi:sensor domain-containing protein [Aureimonas leprariae]|uniref:EAL domain-containing protein n=1 Tax=Plantimonas leprariae TaxID=2615207 RepID=A0A7V7PMU3_9HYPH|nr:EAL domain-containing protein [Aureimonas leprariae]KAB0678797.1 EAL domain-containing protein [Aureimonas leprariae]